MVVQDQLIKFGLHPTNLELGEVIISEELKASEKKQLNEVLLSFGFVLIDDKKSQLIEKIKNAIVELVHHSDEALKINLSNHISEKLYHNYHYLSNLFTELEGITIEHFYIAQKIERVKELLIYDELSLSEIAFKLNYSSSSHLGKQFKKATGFTTSHFKQLKDSRRTPIEEL